MVDDVCWRLLEIASCDQPVESCDSGGCGLKGVVESWAVGGAPSDHTHATALNIKEEMNGSLEWVLLHSEPSPAPLLHLLSSFLYNLKVRCEQTHKLCTNHAPLQAPVLSCSTDMVWLFPPHPQDRSNPLSKVHANTQTYPRAHTYKLSSPRQGCPLL